ncbi:MAG: hypothetical protein NPIRA05_18420 [Nitrospirales bacterium]|nr:MAG: hypothetical protein NPIRA05_18420 [Nitrospirales bacterium]
MDARADVSIRRRWLVVGVVAIAFSILATSQFGRGHAQKTSLNEEKSFLTRLLVDLRVDKYVLNETLITIQDRISSTIEIVNILTQNDFTQIDAEILSDLERHSFQDAILFSPKVQTIGNTNPSLPVFANRTPALYRDIVHYYDAPGIPGSSDLGYNKIVSTSSEIRISYEETSKHYYQFERNIMVSPYIDIRAREHIDEYVLELENAIKSLEHYEFRYLQFRNRNDWLQDQIEKRCKSIVSAIGSGLTVISRSEGNL